MAEKPTASAAPKSDSSKEEPLQRPPPGPKSDSSKEEPPQRPPPGPKSDSSKEEPPQRPPPGLPPSIQRLFSELFAEKENTGQQQASANENQADIEESRYELEHYNAIMLHELESDMGNPDTR